MGQRVVLWARGRPHTGEQLKAFSLATPKSLERVAQEIFALHIGVFHVILPCVCCYQLRVIQICVQIELTWQLWAAGRPHYAAAALIHQM